MNLREYEELSGTKVDPEVYHGVIEPMYMATDLSKEEFIHTIDTEYFAIEQQPEVIKIGIEFAGCKYDTNLNYYYKEADLLDIDIATGKYVVALHEGFGITREQPETSYRNCIKADRTPVTNTDWKKDLRKKTYEYIEENDFDLDSACYFAMESLHLPLSEYDKYTYFSREEFYA